MIEKTDAAVAAAMLGSRLNGLRLLRVQRLEFEWVFEFGPNRVLQVSFPWRILLNGRIAFASSDDGHQFGLPQPVDGEKETRKIFAEKTIQQIAIREDTGDLSISFDEGTVLEVINMSLGYEGWQIGAVDIRVIALGGGELAIFSDAHE